jgi:hypothetical protein
MSELQDYLMQGQLSLTTPAHVFAASPSIRKDVVDRLKVRHVETHAYEEVGLLESSTQQHKANTTCTTEKVVYKPLQPASSQHDLWQPGHAQEGNPSYANPCTHTYLTFPD